MAQPATVPTSWRERRRAGCLREFFVEGLTLLPPNYLFCVRVLRACCAFPWAQGCCHRPRLAILMHTYSEPACLNTYAGSVSRFEDLRAPETRKPRRQRGTGRRGMRDPLDESPFQSKV